MQLDGRAAVHFFVRFDQFFHDRRHRRGTTHRDFAGGFGAGEGRRVVQRDIVVIFHDLLAIRAEDEVFGDIVHVIFGHDVERTGHGIRTGFDVVYRGFVAVDFHRLDFVVQRTQRHITDRLLVAGHAGDHTGSVVGHVGFLGSVVHLVAIGIFFFNAEQFDKRATGTGSLFTRDDGDGTAHTGRSIRCTGLVGAAVGIAVRGRAARQHKGQGQGCRCQFPCSFHLSFLQILL